MRPLTDDRPKPMIEINGRPFLAHIVNRLAEEGFERVEMIDGWYGRGIDAGATGGTMCGAGGGGFLLFLAEPEHRQKVLEALDDLTCFPIGYEAHGSRVLLAQLD